MPVPMPRKVAPAVLATLRPWRLPGLYGVPIAGVKNNDLSFYNTSDIF